MKTKKKKNYLCGSEKLDENFSINILQRISLVSKFTDRNSFDFHKFPFLDIEIEVET